MSEIKYPEIVIHPDLLTSYAREADKAYKRGFSAGFKAGAEAMREMAAKTAACSGRFLGWNKPDEYKPVMGNDVAEAIRSLPLPTEGDPKEGK